MSKLLSASQVAKAIGCHRTYIAQRTNKINGIKGLKIGNAYVYEQKDVKAFRKIFRPQAKD